MSLEPRKAAIDAFLVRYYPEEATTPNILKWREFREIVFWCLEGPAKVLPVRLRGVSGVGA